MARLLTQTLIRTQSINQTHRFFSSQSPKTQLIEIDLESSSSSSDTDVEVLGIRKLEDAIHSIIVRQSKPDWLPFVPGSSYWVPPRIQHKRISSTTNDVFGDDNDVFVGGSSTGIVGLLSRFNENKKQQMMTMLNDDESRVVLNKGWPSYAYFVQGISTVPPLSVEMEAEVVHSNEENIPDTKNEEG